MDSSQKSRARRPRGRLRPNRPAIVGRAGFAARFRNYLLAGIIVTAPISITLFIVWQVVSWVDGAAASLIPDRYNPNTYLPFGIPGIGFLLMLAILAGIGWFAAGIVGRSIMRTGERLVHRMPVVRSIYSTLKQIFETVLADSSRSFREVVLVEWPRRDCWAFAFVTGFSNWQVDAHPGERMVNLFLPSTPNPTTGFFLMVPEQDLIHLDLTVEEGMRMIISGGIVNLPVREHREDEEPQQRSLELAEPETTPG